MQSACQSIHIVNVIVRVHVFMKFPRKFLQNPKEINSTYSADASVVV